MFSKDKSGAKNQKVQNHKKTSINKSAAILTNKVSYRIILSFAIFIVVASAIFVSGLAQVLRPSVSQSNAKADVIGQSSETFSARVDNETDKPDEIVPNPPEEIKSQAGNNPEGVNPVSVTATAGTTGPTTYLTLKDAFDAINAGTHQGVITINIVGNSTETATAALNASGSGSASYTSVSIQPVGGMRTITGSIVGAIIKLVGADNVTIDGRISGSGRNLIVSNTNTAAATAAIWLTSTGVGAGATNNTIRNLEISCGATQNTGTNSTFGIIMASNNTAISTSSNSDDNDNNSFIANRIIRARYGIVTRGTTTNLALNTFVSDNIIGPTSFGADQIGKVGIFMQADQGATVTRNTVQFVGGDFANTTGGADRVGIGIGQESWSASPSTLTSNTYTVTKNIIHDVVDERTFSAVGLLLGTTGGGSATNNLVANNFIYNVKSNGTSGDQTVGLGISGGHTDRVVFNSISLTGDVDPNAAATATTNYGSGIRIGNASGSTHANLTLQNNSVYLDLSSSSTATVRYYAVSGNAASFSFGTGGENYNNYYINPANTQLQTGGLGSTSGNTLTTQFATLANWQTAYTAAQDANSIQADPQHVSPTADLHIAMASPNVNAGTAIAGVIDDIDDQLRVAAPDIGADEPDGVTPPVNDISASSFISPTNGATVAATVAFAPQASFTGIGTATQTNVPVRYRILDGMMAVVCNVTATIPSIANGQTITATFPNCTVPSAGTFSIIATSELVGDTNSSNNEINGTVTAALPLTGTYTVPGDFASLTNSGGIFERLNSVGATGNIVINITADLTGENGTVALNELAGGFTVSIKPSGAPRSITGSSTNSIIRLNGADNVTINGSTSMMVLPEAVGGNPALRELTVTNTNTTATAGAVIAVMSGTNGAQNNTIKNVNISGQDPTQTLIGLHLGGNSVGVVGTDNDNNRVENCSIQKAFIGIYNTGASAANQNTGNVVTMNDLSATGANRLRRAGMLFFNHDGLQVTMNLIGGITSDEGLDAYGIGAGIQAYDTTTTTSGAITNSVISKNKINGIASTSTTGFSAIGIGISGGTAGPNTISNNMISGIIAPSTSPDLVAGIFVAGVASSTTRLYHNSVSLTGDRGSVASQIGSYGVAITGTNPTVELKNNIFSNTLISGGGANAKSYSIGMVTTTFTNLNSNFNDFFTSGANSGGWRRGGLGATATDDTTLAAWQAATSQDANSQAVDPMFVSTTDLHLQVGSPMVNTGTTGTGVTDDIDDQMRDAVPDIGADELLAGTLQFSSATYSVGEGGGMVTLTVTRTGGSDGAVSVNYALSGGNATGGATCGAMVDYVNTGGTVMLANGETSKTFDVTICEDAVFEGNETFNATLSMATGGATIGTPNPATVTINDNEVAMPGTLQFSAGTYMVGEAGGMVTLTVTRTGGSDGGVQANYALSGGNATGGATCGGMVDYVNTGGTLMFANGETSKSFDVTICNDMDVEGNETFEATLSGATGGATIGTPNPATVTINDDDMPVSPVTVTATAGTATGSYMNLTAAVAAVNDGTHQGDIVININQTITEPGTVVVNSSGAGAAVYTSILIRPTADGISVSGLSAQGRGLIELNGADNVTIDGDNPNSMGINRNLTLQNTAANTTTFTSVVRIALATTVVNSADNNTIKNLNIVGSATGRNISTATSTTASENTTFGIFAGLGGSTVSGTTAPSAVTSVSTSVGAGATATNLMISNNSITTVGRGVSMNGSATSVFPGLQIKQNRIGNQTAGDADQVYSIGITGQGTADGLISNNTVWVEGFIASSAATHGINVGVNSATGTFTIERNMVNRVRNRNPATWSAFGINLGGGSNHVVQNNFVSGVINSQVAGTGGFGTTFGAYGIRIASGTGHKVYHNSVHLYDALAGTVSTDLTAAFLMSATTQTGVDVRNNIFVNRIAGGNPTGTRNVAVYLPSGATSAMNLTFNNNAYFVGTHALNRLAKVGATFGALEFQATDFDPTATTPATNFRSYTSTLSAAGTNDNASFASTAPPPFTSNVNLHIPAGTATRLESGGAMIGVTTDIDLEMRNAATPDIGADEFAGMPPFANDIAAVVLVNPVNGAVIPVGQTFSPQATFTNNGTATQTNVTVRYQILDVMMTVIYNQTVNISTIAPLQNAVVTFSSTSLMNSGTYTIRATSELSGDQDITNDTISGMVTAVPPITGTVTVGTGGTYTSLTNVGGLFEALNTAGISGSVTVNIISDLTGETGAVPLNQFVAQFAESGGASTLTIKPSGAARTISGTSAASSGLIILHGADNVIIDGSLSGGTDRSLTITNNQATTGIVIWMRSPGIGNGATNNTIKNCIINGAPGPNSTTVAGILTGSSVTLGNAAEAPNSNNTIQNNWIYRVQNSMYLRGGALPADFDQNWVVTGNELGSTAANDKNIFRGMLIGSAQNFTVTGNIIHGIQSTGTTTAAMSGIQIAFLVNTGTIANNVISDIKNVSTSGTGAFGMQIGASSTNSNVTIANNFIYDIATTGLAAVNSNSHGLMFNGSGTGYNVYFNSVNMNTNQGTGTTSSAMNVNSTFATAGALNVRNNIFANTQTTGTRYAVYSTATAGVFTAINYNDYFAQNVGFIGGSARATLSDWQTATGQDTNSLAVNPLFVTPTDLHIQLTSPMFNAGVSGTGITTDIDGNPRDATPDIGADELFNAAGILSLSSSTYTVGETAGTVSITVNRTGTTGAVSVDYSMMDGTATGGAACGGNVDYVNTGGTLMFADGQASKTFVVTICPDSHNKTNETFSLTLSNPTGGAIVGGISTAVVTILDDDPMPSISITDVTLNEGNAGTTNFTFNVNLSAASGQTVTVHYQTANGTATVADNDYNPIADTVLTFNPGQTTLPVTVLVNGDTNVEPGETFFVNLSSAINATISDNQGVGTITNDDFLPGTLTINDVKITEGNTGTSTATFTVTLIGGLPMETVQYQTANGTATSGSDYQSTSGTLNFDNPPSTEGGPPTRTRTINVTINGDMVSEANETFFVNLSNPSASTITDGQGVGIIIDDERAIVSDFDNDRKSDISLFRPGNGTWYTIQSTNNVPAIVQFGVNGDKAVPGDYDGDGITDRAVWRPSQGIWYIFNSSNSTLQTTTWGLNGDIPVQGDYNGDGKTDLAVFRPSDTVWYILQNPAGPFSGFQFGISTDLPVQGDYDGDAKTDIAVFRNGTWYILRSSDNSVSIQNWGVSTDKVVSGDFDGDGKADLTIFRDGVWWIRLSLTGTVRTIGWGLTGDIPAAADYDGDGTSDIAVFRPSNGIWYVLRSSDNGITSLSWGQMNDIPVPSAYLPQ